MLIFKNIFFPKYGGDLLNGIITIFIFNIRETLKGGISMELKRLSLLDERVKDRYLVNKDGEIFNLSHKPLKVDGSCYKLILTDGKRKIHPQG